MKVLITNGGSRLSRELATALGENHDVTLTASGEVRISTRSVQSHLGHDEATNALVRDMEVVVHSGEPDPHASVSEQLDVAMRCTYNLLLAAVEERVPRIVFLSSLGLLDQFWRKAKPA